jgi:hypothetical protein
VLNAAYGFRIAGGPQDGWFALHGADDWPLLTLAADDTVTPDDQARVDWGRLHAGVCAALPQDEIVHPVLGRMLPLLAETRGIDAMHGGALVGADGAWVVIGAREAGKSTLLAQCHRQGAPVATDDIVVLEGTRCLSGPRCIDLRAGAARTLGPGVAVRGGTKERLKLPPVAAEVELAGIVYLAWGPETELVALRPSDSLRRLAALRAEEGWPRDASLLLDLAARPAYELRRPRDLDSLAPSAALLIERLGAVA